MGDHRVEPFSLSGVTAELIDGSAGQRQREGILDFGKLGIRQGGQGPSPDWLVW